MQAIVHWFQADPFGFYNSEVHGEPPAGAVVITEAERDALLQGQAQGQLIGTDSNGRPVLMQVQAQSPERVSMRQARLALLAAGKLKAVNDAIAALPSPQKEAAQIEWDYATTVDRDSPFVQQLAQALGLDADALEALFTRAATY